MNRPTVIIIAACVIIVLFHVWGAVHPIHENWGGHFFAFLSPVASIVALIVLGLLALPKVQSRALKRFEQFINSIAKLPAIIGFLVAAAILFAGVYFFKVELHLLGDGAVLLRSVPLGITGTEITQSFRNQPLMFWIYRWAMTLHPVDVSPDPYTVYFTIDIIAALLFLLLIFWGMRALKLPPVERVLLGVFLFLGTGSQFFFGYVENYILLYVATMAYVITGWFALERKITIVLPMVCFVLMVLLHLGSMVFLLSTVLLILFRWKKNLRQAVILLTAIGVVGVVVLYAVGFNLIDMTRHLQSGTVDFLKPFSGASGNFPYPMFSLVHLLDWINAHMLLVPFGLVLTVILVTTLPKERRWNNPILLFLLTASACGMFFSWVINSALGIARDWDLFSSFFVPLMVLPVYLFSQQSTLSNRRYVLVLVVVVTFLHWASWIGVNANGNSHLARMKALNSPKLLSKAAHMAYDEALANFFFDTGRYADARVYYEHYMTIDNDNPRIIGNIADVYRKLGEKDLYFAMLKYAVEKKSPDPGVYSNLGVEYASRGDTALAIEFNERAISMNPAMQKAYANLGILYASQKNYTLADRHFTTAINLGMQEPLLFRYAADVCVFLRDFRRALQYYDAYLAATPNDNKVKAIRQRVYEVVAEMQKHQ